MCLSYIDGFLEGMAVQARYRPRVIADAPVRLLIEETGQNAGAMYELAGD